MSAPMPVRAMLSATSPRDPPRTIMPKSIIMAAAGPPEARRRRKPLSSFICGRMRRPAISVPSAAPEAPRTTPQNAMMPPSWPSDGLKAAVAAETSASMMSDRSQRCFLESGSHSGSPRSCGGSPGARPGVRSLAGFGPRPAYRFPNSPMRPTTRSTMRPILRSQSASAGAPADAPDAPAALAPVLGVPVCSGGRRGGPATIRDRRGRRAAAADGDAPRDAVGDHAQALGAEARDTLLDVLRAEHRLDHLLHRLIALGRVLCHRLLDDGAEGLLDAGDVRLGRHVLHQDLARAAAQKRRLPGEHLVEHGAQRVDVDAFVVLPAADLRRHVVDRADRDGLPAMLRRGNRLAQAVIADFHVAVFVEDVRGLEVAVDDAAVVQEREPLSHLAEEEGGLLRAQPPGGFIQDLPQVRTRDELHDDE